jgi:urease accessory protein
MKRNLQMITGKGLLAGVLAALLVPSLAYAHVGVGQVSGFSQGVVHPLMGLDHMAAMLAVGFWATQLGGRALWLVPLSFVGIMVGAGLLGASGIAMPFVELGIVGSVFLLGVLIAAAIRLPLLVSSLLVGLFAIFHGYAHGAEMSVSVSGLEYGLGFLLATGLLHGCGLGLGLLARRWGGVSFARYAGGATAAIGVYLFIG